LECKPKKDYAKTEGIEPSEIERTKGAAECLRCAWPVDRKGNHRVKDCVRPITLEKGTASYPKAKEYQKMKVAGLEGSSEGEEDSYSESSESSESSDTEEEISECEYLDQDKEDQEQQEEEGNWWDSPPDLDLDLIRQATLRLQVAN
jgi:hypothetical protein